TEHVDQRIIEGAARPPQVREHGRGQRLDVQDIDEVGQLRGKQPFVDLPEELQIRQFVVLWRPDVAEGAYAGVRVLLEIVLEDGVDRVARGFVRRLHRRQPRVGLHVRSGQHEAVEVDVVMSRLARTGRPSSDLGDVERRPIFADADAPRGGFVKYEV